MVLVVGSWPGERPGWKLRAAPGIGWGGGGGVDPTQVRDPCGSLRAQKTDPMPSMLCA